MKPVLTAPPRREFRPPVRKAVEVKRQASPPAVRPRAAMPAVLGQTGNRALERFTPARVPVIDVPAAQLRPNPYVDFFRDFTAAGGIRIAYKDLDTRFRFQLRSFVLWGAATALGALYLLYGAGGPAIGKLVCFLIAAIINWLIVRGTPEVMRSIEIRPDCMILEDTEVFWRENMELGFPQFQQGGEGHLVLSGTYGTRAMEYLTVRRFDPLDRAPEVVAAHLGAAMHQQWLGRDGTSQT